MNWTSISNASFFGKVLRLPLRLIPGRAVLPILQGPLRGKKWIAGSGNHGYWLGSYEMEKCVRFAEAVPAGGVVFDLGGNVGYYTLISSFRAGPRGRVFVFEPLPRNLDFLRRHLALNRIENVTVIDAAVSDRSGTVRFAEDASTSKGRIGEGGSLEVKSISLDDWIDTGASAGAGSAENRYRRRGTPGAAGRAPDAGRHPSADFPLHPLRQGPQGMPCIPGIARLPG